MSKPVNIVDLYDATYETETNANPAYSATRYGKRQWRLLIEALVEDGLSARQVEAILRSKYTRWAADRGEDSDHPTAEEAFAWIKGSLTQKQLDELVEETFR